MRLTTGAAVVLLAAAVSQCARSGPIDRDQVRSVLLVTIDTLRADAVGAYGRTGAGTPWMDRLAAAGVRFDDARAHNVVTLPSHANILSGRLPLDHGVRDNAGFRFPAATETLATLLKARGYRTGAFVSAFPLDSRFGLARGFDVYDDRFADAGPRPVFLIEERRGTETVALAQRWIESAGGEPWFCWVHLYEPHYPYEPSYAGEVAAVDAALGPLLGPILDADRAGRTLVVLTSDHGEALGDHGEATHGVFAYEPVLKVPLLLYQPRLFSPAVVHASAGHVDVLPTILEALSLPVPPGLAGRSLLPAATGKRGEADVTYFEALSPSLNRGWAPLFGLVRNGTKYIDLPIPELYDLRSDPREAHNLAGSNPQRVEEMRALLGRLRQGHSDQSRTPESAETRDRLRSLGYLASRTSPAPARYTEDDDPKRLIALDALLQDVVALYLDGDVRGALARCRELVRRRPDAPLSLLQLAHLEREAGNLPAAIEALRKVVAIDPDHDEAVPLLGAYLTQAGRAREAVDLLEPHARAPGADAEVLTTRALALATLGRTEEALATLTDARERDPENAMTLVELGTIQLMADDRTRARESFEQAVAINPSVARAHSSLGVLALEEGRREQAFTHWRAATALDVREHEKVLGLGIALARAGRTAEARACFEFFVASAPPSRYSRDIERARQWLRQS